MHLALIRFWSAIAWNAFTHAEALERRGHRVWTAAPAGSPLARRAAAGDGGQAPPGAGGLTLPYVRPHSWCRVVWELRRMLTRHRIDLVYVHTGSGHLEAHLARSGLPTALVRVRADARRPRGSLPQRWLHRHGTERVALSGAYMEREHLGGWSLPPGHAIHLPPGIDVERIAADPRFDRTAARAELAARHGLPENEPWVGIVGRLSRVKGHEVLIQAAAMVLRRGLPGRVVVVGAEKEVSVAHLQSLARSLGIADRILFAGYVEDALRYAAAMDVGVISSLGSEAVSRSALEFMALRVPVVATRVGILPEVIARDDLLVAPGDREALAERLARLIADAPFRIQAGIDGHRRARAEYGLAGLGERLERIGREAVAARQAHLSGGRP
jgi:glycosyltransferase involved in cell wall biosynthesis